MVKLELLVDEQELEMLPRREPYELNEYPATLIRTDDQLLKSEIKEMSKKTCRKYGEKLPVAECCLSGDSECWNTYGRHKFKLCI
nr:hypothetical protein [Morganella morganii]